MGGGAESRCLLVLCYATSLCYMYISVNLCVTYTKQSGAKKRMTPMIDEQTAAIFERLFRAQAASRHFPRLWARAALFEHAAAPAWAAPADHSVALWWLERHPSSTLPVRACFERHPSSILRLWSRLERHFSSIFRLRSRFESVISRHLWLQSGHFESAAAARKAQSAAYSK